MRKKLKTWSLPMGLSISLALALGTAGAAAPTAAASHDRAPSTAAASAAEPGPRSELITVRGIGSGKLKLAGFTGDTVSFHVRASAPADAPWTAEGSFDVAHIRPDGTVLADFGGTLSCLMVGADVAVATGTITRGGAAGLPGEELGHQVGLTIADHGRRDHVGWSWLVMGFHDAPPCTSTAPFFPIAEGNFVVDGPRRPHD